jgi:hypothetical protein
MGENEAVRLVGLDVNGGPVFDVVLSVPDALAMDRHCSEAQLAAVTKFYCRDFAADELTDFQAHGLLSYRQYAQECASALFNQPKIALLYARLVAAYISSNRVIADYAIDRSNRRFRVGADKSYVVRTKHFGEVAVFRERIGLELQRHGVNF